MFLHVTEAEYLEAYKLRLSFNDGNSGVIDLSAELLGEVFLPLRDKETFQSFKLGGHTLSWYTGADFAPGFLRNLLLEQKDNG